MNAVAKVPVSCPQCGKQLNVPTTAAGKQGRCPACSHVFVLPALLETPTADDLPQLAPLASDPFGPVVPTSGYQLPPAAPQGGYYQQPAGYGSPSYSQPPAQQSYAPQQQPVNPYMANAYAQAAENQSSQNPQKYNHAFGLEQRGWDAGMMGGLLMMVIGGLWFVGGLFFGIIFYYAPILFIIGMVGFVRGLFSGNIAGRSE